MEKTPLSEIFRGQLRTRTVKNGENEPTENIEPFFTLKLDIEVYFIKKLINYNTHHVLQIYIFILESKICSRSFGHASQ